MISHQDLVQLWGEANICRVREEILERLDLPGEAKLVLSQLGLPVAAEPLFVTELCRTDRGLTFVDSPNIRGRWFCIGSDYGNDMCVHANSGEVRSLSSGGTYMERFVNSSVGSFVAFLYLVCHFRATFRGRDDGEIDDALMVLERQLRELDPKAFSHVENWWSVIMEQMKAGLL